MFCSTVKYVSVNRHNKPTQKKFIKNTIKKYIIHLCCYTVKYVIVKRYNKRAQKTKKTGTLSKNLLKNDNKPVLYTVKYVNINRCNEPVLSTVRYVNVNRYNNPSKKQKSQSKNLTKRYKNSSVM